MNEQIGAAAVRLRHTKWTILRSSAMTAVNAAAPEREAAGRAERVPTPSRHHAMGSAEAGQPVVGRGSWQHKQPRKTPTSECKAQVSPGWKPPQEGRGAVKGSHHSAGAGPGRNAETSLASRTRSKENPSWQGSGLATGHPTMLIRGGAQGTSVKVWRYRGTGPHVEARGRTCPRQAGAGIASHD